MIRFYGHKNSNSLNSVLDIDTNVLCQWEHIKCDICDLLFYHVHVSSILSKLYANFKLFIFFFFAFFAVSLCVSACLFIVTEGVKYQHFFDFSEKTVILFVNDLRMTFNNASVSIYTLGYWLASASASEDERKMKRQTINKEITLTGHFNYLLYPTWFIWLRRAFFISI